ncbi:tram-like protein [Campylobacter estrildidarum]|uniref:Tram-like protein n=1 Tax=Campylobacter estrildidarum TaxID=2510189 RepID=A0A4U7BIK4_9BACT|nr:tram-like protein [Campylobacter estrildidarum]TKX31329.1 tram-like protein [Campylobacter estrildidarum]
MNILNEAINILNLNLKPFDLKPLTNKRSYLCAIDNNNLLFVYIGKARFVKKDALYLDNLANNFELKHKFFFTKSALCSKAKLYLKEKGFNIYAAL